MCSERFYQISTSLQFHVLVQQVLCIGLAAAMEELWTLGTWLCQTPDMDLGTVKPQTLKMVRALGAQVL